LASAAFSSVTKQIDALFRTGTAVGLSDSILLDRFHKGRRDDAEAAFGTLVERHSSMVHDVCLRILGDRHDAEDAAQAVFLVLARQPGSIRRTDSVASWLYGVAVRVAARARLDAARRRLRERRGAERSMAIRDENDSDRDRSETWPELYQELSRLPDRFRLPILLCHLQGLTYEQAAQQLCCPVRTVQSRLVRARERLRGRLARRGLGPALGAFFVELAADTASAAVSDRWKDETVAAAIRYASGGTAAAAVPSTVTVLAQGALRAMRLKRLTQWMAALFLCGIALGGAGMAVRARSAPPEPESNRPADPPQNRYRLAMAEGATFEVVAVSSFPSGPKTWWRPDGTPFEKAPVDPLSTFHPGHPDEQIRVILVQVRGLPKDANLRWLPTFDSGYSGLSPTWDGRKVPDLEAYIVSLRPDRKTCDVKVRLAAGAWKTEVSNDGRGGTGQFVNGHKFTFGKARLSAVRGRQMTVFAVAHNFFGQDRRMVAVDREGAPHPAVSYSAGSDGDPKWVIDIIDAEFALPPDQIKEYQVQFRPFELAEIRDIALKPVSTAQGTTKLEDSDLQPSTIATVTVDPNADRDGDGLADYQEIFKYRTDPTKRSTAGDDVADGDPQRRLEFTYSIRSVVKVMPPVNLGCLNDDYQDARVLSQGENYAELEVIHFPLNSNADSVRGNPDWRRDAGSKQEYVRPGITTNWDDAMRRDLVAALKTDGIDPDRLDDKELVLRTSTWLMANMKYMNMFCTHYMHYPEGRAAIYPGLEDRFEAEKGDRAWTVQEQLDHELFGRSMFAHRTHGSCTSMAVLITTVLRALGIPTRMVLGIPMVDGNDPAQLAKVRNGIHHDRVRKTLLQGLAGAKGYANHTFNEVFVGGRWVRLNYNRLGQNTMDGSLMGLLTHVNTFNDLADVPLAATWGKRYAKGERDPVFRFGNPYRCEEISDHFGKFAKVENPEHREHRALTISRAYWADDPDAHAIIKDAKWLHHTNGARSLLVHGEEWFDDDVGSQYRPFLEAAGKVFLFKAEGQPDVKGRTTASSITWHSRGLHEIEVVIPPEEYAKMEPNVVYTLQPLNDVAGYEWKVKGRVTITKKP
jgi:RNA polymerase sigma factor (sigma-70 family)